MKMKTNSLLSLCVALSAISVTSASLQASTTDSRIESSARKSYVFKTYLKDDSIKIDSKDGVVTLGGIAKNGAEEALVTKLVSDINGVNSVVNTMTVAVPVAKS